MPNDATLGYGTEEKLRAAILSADAVTRKEAWAKVWKGWAGLVFCQGRRLKLDDHELEDARNDTIKMFVRWLIERPWTPCTVGQFYCTAGFACLQIRDKRIDRRDGSIPDGLEPADATSEADTREAREHARWVIETNLTPDERVLLMALHLGEPRIAELARERGVSKSTLYKQGNKLTACFRARVPANPLD